MKMKVFEILRTDITAPSDSELASILGKVDWGYEFSDNERTIARGKKMMEQVENMVYQSFKVNPTKTMTLWRKYCPWAKKLDESVLPDFIQRFQTIDES